MADHEWLADQFEDNRAHLQKVAYRILGSSGEADDAVQEAWLRLSRSDAGRIDNLSGWLTTVVARVCLDVLRSRRLRQDERLEDQTSESVEGLDESSDPERDMIATDSMGVALFVLLDTLTPAERVAFVLHDLFSVSFSDIASIVGRTPEAARQLASRARRRVQGAPAPTDVDRTHQRRLVEAFLTASHAGDFAALLELLDPDVVLSADPAAVRMGASAELRGAAAVAETFKGRAQGARLALVDGMVGLGWAPRGQRRVVFEFATDGGRITGINLCADRERLRQFEIIPLGAEPPASAPTV